MAKLTGDDHMDPGPETVAQGADVDNVRIRSTVSTRLERTSIDTVGSVRLYIVGSALVAVFGFLAVCYIGHSLWWAAFSALAALLPTIRILIWRGRSRSVPRVQNLVHRNHPIAFRRLVFAMGVICILIGIVGSVAISGPMAIWPRFFTGIVIAGLVWYYGWQCCERTLLRPVLLSLSAWIAGVGGNYLATATEPDGLGASINRAVESLADLVAEVRGLRDEVRKNLASIQDHMRQIGDTLAALKSGANNAFESDVREHVATIVPNPTKQNGSRLGDASANMPQSNQAFRIDKLTEGIIRATEIPWLIGELRKSGDPKLIVKALQLILERNSTAPSTMRLSLLLEIAEWASVIGDLEQASAALKEAIELAPDDADTLNRTAQIHELQDRLDEAHRNYTRMFELCAGDDVCKAVASNNLANVLARRGETKRAEELYLTSLELSTKLKWADGIADSYASLGSFYLGIGDFPRAEDFLGKAKDMSERLGRLQTLPGILGNLGSVYLARREFDRAEGAFTSSIALHEKLSYTHGAATQYANLGTVYLGRDDLERAEEKYLEARRLFRQLGARSDIAMVNRQLASVEYGRKEFIKARELITEALRIDIEVSNLAGQADDYLQLANIHGMRSELGEARDKFGKALELNIKLNHRERIALAYVNIGQLDAVENKMDAARSNWSKAQEIYTEIGMEHMVSQVQDFIDKSLIGQSTRP